MPMRRSSGADHAAAAAAAGGRCGGAWGKRLLALLVLAVLVVPHDATAVRYPLKVTFAVKSPNATAYKNADGSAPAIQGAAAASAGSGAALLSVAATRGGLLDVLAPAVDAKAERECKSRGGSVKITVAPTSPKSKALPVAVLDAACSWAVGPPAAPPKSGKPTKVPFTVTAECVKPSGEAASQSVPKTNKRGTMALTIVTCPATQQAFAAGCRTEAKVSATENVTVSESGAFSATIPPAALAPGSTVGFELGSAAELLPRSNARRRRAEALTGLRQLADKALRVTPSSNPTKPISIAIQGLGKPKGSIAASANAEPGRWCPYCFLTGDSVRYDASAVTLPPSVTVVPVRVNLTSGPSNTSGGSRVFTIDSYKYGGVISLDDPYDLFNRELEAVLFDVSGPSLAGPTSTSAAGAASAQQQAAPQGVPAPAPGAVCIGSPLLWPVAPADIRDVSSGILEGLPGLELYVTRRAPVYAAHSGFLTSEEFVGDEYYLSIRGSAGTTNYYGAADIDGAPLDSGVARNVVAGELIGMKGGSNEGRFMFDYIPDVMLKWGYVRVDPLPCLGGSPPAAAAAAAGAAAAPPSAPSLMAALAASGQDALRACDAAASPGVPAFARKLSLDARPGAGYTKIPEFPFCMAEAGPAELAVRTTNPAQCQAALTWPDPSSVPRPSRGQQLLLSLGVQVPAPGLPNAVFTCTVEIVAAGAAAGAPALATIVVDIDQRFRYVPKVMGRLGDSLPVRNFPCSYRNAPKPGKAVCGDKVQLPNRYYVETQPEASFSGRTFESLYFRSCDEDLAYSGGRSWPCEFCSDAPGAGADEPYRYTAVVAANGGVRYIEQPDDADDLSMAPTKGAC